MTYQTLFDLGEYGYRDGPYCRVEQVATRRPNGSGHGRRTWESFAVAEVAFAFDRGPSPVGFRNQFEAPVDLRDGQRLRVHYVEDVPGDRTQRRIVRLERAR